MEGKKKIRGGGGGEAQTRQKGLGEGVGKEGKQKMGELGHKAPKGKTMGSQKDLRNDCETISFLSCERTSEVIRTT